MSGLGTYVDCADLDQLTQLALNPRVTGFTTNPTLMRKAGVVNYENFGRQAISVVAPRAISFEVIADDLEEMKRQALKIASWGSNVYVKVPVTNTVGVSTARIIAELGAEGVQLNVTAVFTLEQVCAVAEALPSDVPSILSVFAGRIADAGIDPVPIMSEAKRLLRGRPLAKLLWASPREILNVVQAEQCGVDIITMTPELWAKVEILGKDLGQYSLETVSMFYGDAVAAGYRL